MRPQLGSTPFYATRPIPVNVVDTRINNCGNFITTGNCVGDPKWDMPSAHWWLWGFGAAPAYGFNVQNPSGYDFVGGTTYSYNDVTAVNSYTFTTTSDIVHGVVEQIKRNYNNCNCNAIAATGPMNVNCYSNCNCNCNCVCVCICDCGK